MRKTLLIALLAAGLAAFAAVTASGSANRTPPLIGGYYDGKGVTYLLTDVSQPKDAKALSKATGFRVNYVPKLNRAPESALAKLYLFTNGVKGPNPFGFQANVVDSIPGAPGYSPLWRVYAVTWATGAKAKLLTSEDAILVLQKTGKLTIKRTPLIKNSPIVP